ncbi:beta-lactamase class A [Rhodoligotrophos appendicifer]|uniref:class A beta-lactamase n=1 Tax=Rhodoligotrophos appendicifer TaxID=987056 RepID=UPI00117DF5D0|nr:class A beta-lactamase [Rhodoligotrophos appendicifer]
MITRRAIILGSLMATPSLLGVHAAEATMDDRLRDVEARNGGQLGVAILDLASGHVFGHRADERFPLLSTVKLLAAAHVLARVDRGQERLDRRVIFSKRDLVTYSPMTEGRVGAPGMTMAELCDAAIATSDNTAGNLLLASAGGPAGLTRFLRSIGDEVTGLTRIEPFLNSAVPGDLHDTTTPRAMLETMRKLLVDDGLSETSRRQLAAWLVANKTGDKRIRAGIPKTWRVGDKTGTNQMGACDVAIVWPPARKPILVTVYYASKPGQTAESRDAVIAAVGRLVAGI